MADEDDRQLAPAILHQLDQPLQRFQGVAVQVVGTLSLRQSAVRQPPIFLEV